jgi:hypothetical protein
MEILDIFLGNKILFFKGAISSNDKWQFIIALIILVFGFLLMEFLWRHIGGRLRAFLEKKGYKQNAPYFMGFFPSFRLAGVALILKIAEAPIAVPERLEVLLYGLEIFLLSLAAISFIFQVVRLLDLLYSSLSARTRKKVPKGSLQALKGFLRITGIILVASAFAFTQKEFFPEWLWHHSGWRYVAVLVIFIIVFLGGRAGKRR